MYGTPTMYIDLTTVLKERVKNDPELLSKLNCLERFFSGGSICLPEVIKKLKQQLKSIKFTVRIQFFHIRK